MRSFGRTSARRTQQPSRTEARANPRPTATWRWALTRLVGSVASKPQLASHPERTRRIWGGLSSLVANGFGHRSRGFAADSTVCLRERVFLWRSHGVYCDPQYSDVESPNQVGAATLIKPSCPEKPAPGLTVVFPREPEIQPASKRPKANSGPIAQVGKRPFREAHAAPYPETAARTSTPKKRAAFPPMSRPTRSPDSPPCCNCSNAAQASLASCWG